MKTLLIIGLLGFIGSLPANAQTKQWSLRECCDYAVEHNISIKQQENQCLKQELQLSTSKNSRLPDLSGSVGQNFSFGRGLTAENTYTNTNTSNTSFGLNTSVPLFTGFQIPNQIKLDKLNLEAATADLEKAKNDIRMNVAEAYVQRLTDLENIANSFPGVDKSFAIQAGRELRVMVDTEKVNDDAAYTLATDIAKKIETDLSYPGQIKVIVIRETRVIATAQ